MKIKGKYEDLICKNRDFLQELSRVQDLYYDTLIAELKDDGFEFKYGLENLLFDFIYNSEDESTFEEYLIKYNKTA